MCYYVDMSSIRYRKILHLDLDAFFCAVEELKDPSLTENPLPWAVLQTGAE